MGCCQDAETYRWELLGSGREAQKAFSRGFTKGPVWPPDLRVPLRALWAASRLVPSRSRASPSSVPSQRSAAQRRAAPTRVFRKASPSQDLCLCLCSLGLLSWQTTAGRSCCCRLTEQRSNHTSVSMRVRDKMQSKVLTP